LIRASSESLDSKHLVSIVLGSDYRLLSPLERALITMGRDNALRHVYLRKRWWGREAS
jgi:hypothetical protein